MYIKLFLAVTTSEYRKVFIYFRITLNRLIILCYKVNKYAASVLSDSYKCDMSLILVLKLHY